MTIDEAIEDLRYDAQCNRADLDIEWAERNEQLAEWLEELKVYKDSERLHKRGFEGGYRKAIDDFAEKLHDLCGFEIDYIQYPYLLDESRIDEIAEQLKEGGNNG